MTGHDDAENPTPRAAQQAQENARRPPSDYDDEGRPAASRSRENQEDVPPADDES